MLLLSFSHACGPWNAWQNPYCFSESIFCPKWDMAASGRSHVTVGLECESCILWLVWSGGQNILEWPCGWIWYFGQGHICLFCKSVNSPFSALLREACRLNLAVSGKCLEILLGLNGSHSLLIWADHLSRSKTCPLGDEHHHYSLKAGRVPYSHHDMPPPPHGHYFKACHSRKSILLPPMLHSAPSPNSTTSLMLSVNTFPF